MVRDIQGTHPITPNPVTSENIHNYQTATLDSVLRLLFDIGNILESNKNVKVS